MLGGISKNIIMDFIRKKNIQPALITETRHYYIQNDVFKTGSINKFIQVKDGNTGENDVFYNPSTGEVKIKYMFFGDK